MKLRSWKAPTVIYFLFVEVLVGLVAVVEINRNNFGLFESQESCWGYLSSVAEHIGYRLRLVSCLLLPAVQLVAGISNPTWLSFPFFIGSCVGLVDWSLTSNFLGLFRWWKLLWVYAGLSMCLLYIYQFHFEFPQTFQGIFNSIGLYKISADCDWQEICSGISLMVFYYTLSCVKHDLEDMEFIMSMRVGSLTEQLLPSRKSFFVRQLRSGVRHTNILLRGTVFRIFSINWFTYGFPVSLFALSYWSFHFASICAFGLLAYVGYILYAFPSLFRLHRLNGLLLVFILLWAVSTYVFNVAFAYVDWKLGKDMEIWEIVGLWHYPIPGFFLLAQFCLGILVALGNLVSNSVFLCLSNEERQFSSEVEMEEVKEDAVVLLVATIAWGLHKCSRAIMLLLIFLIATKPGFIHAVYVIFFFAHLLSHHINKRMRQSLILLCEVHFAILYILQLNLVSRKLENEGSLSKEVLKQLGLIGNDSSLDFLEIALLACFCAIHNHGFEMLFSFSAIVQHTPCPPIGFSILRAGFNKSVLLSVYATSNIRDDYTNRSHERKIALYLSEIGKKFLSMYRSFGTYIAFLTILFAVYLVRPNYISFGYIFLLLFWIIGRQLVERTRRRLWFPLKAYAIGVFIFMYILSIFPTIESWMSAKVDLSPATYSECVPAEQYITLTPAADVAKEILKARHTGLVEEVRFPYSILSVIGGGKREIDLYAYIFGADLTVFFLVAIFYQSVIKNKSEFLEYYQLEDQFPIEFVFILMIIFFLIVVDRFIYLCSFATGKVMFYLFNLILFTCAITEYAWNMDTSQQNTAGLALRAIYLTKAVSLALQAMQIRYGIPHKSTLYRQFLTSNVSCLNYLGYRLYRALPFLYELRCVLDWSCTTTSLTMYDWLKLEDINASLYLVKCDNVLNRAKHKQGDKQTKTTKFCNGICLFFVLICVIWAPMMMYSSGNPSNIANPINDATFQLDIKTDAGRLTLFQTTLCKRLPWDHVNATGDLDPDYYLSSYNVNDIQLICCQADATTLWLVPDVVQKQFIQSLRINSMHITYSWVLTRDRPKGKETVKYEKDVDPSDLPKASEIEGVLNGSFSSFRVNNIYPSFFRVTGSGEVRPFEQEVNDVSADLVLHHGSSEWWSFHVINSFNTSRCNGLFGPRAIIVSEETPQGFLGETLSKFSIWGLYITFVLAVGRFIRLQCSDLRMRIPFENLPSCDRLIAICEDIYAARAEGELGVEEVLYWTLVKIYRSPHMLLEYTNPS